ncbi:MAG TPA: NAD-binding protein [Phycisphaerae bacterium]|nr:NAD-binding protein [Phycisphaerae bacterium]HRR84344.1 NAD-binding protein [Phycisphaerae bacterium]
MGSPYRRCRAYIHYLRKPILSFLPFLGLLVTVLIIGTFCFHFLYTHKRLSYAEAFYITYCLVWVEHLIEFPEHWLLRMFYFVLPPLGFLVFLDAVVRFSYHILRRDEAGEEWIRAMCKTLNNHVVLCGLGKLGLRTLQQLIRLGETVAVLEKNPHCPNLAFARNNGIPVRLGHSREEGVFDDLNVAKAKSIILATNDDLANLEMAIDARKLNPSIRVIIRVFDQELAARLRDSFDMPLAFSTSELAAPLFATSSSDPTIVNSFYVGDRLLAVANLTVNEEAELVGRAIRDVGKHLHAFVLSHTRSGQTMLFPSADVVLEAGDAITVQAEPEDLRAIHRMNQS